MESYQKVYHKLFNAMTDLTAEAKDIARRMEAAQQECEEMILKDEETGEKNGTV